MLCSLSPLQMARAKPTTALRPPPASKSSLPVGENPEHIFLEIHFHGMGSQEPGTGMGQGTGTRTSLAEQLTKEKRKKKSTPGAKCPHQAGLLPDFSAISAEHRQALHGFEDSSASPPHPALTGHPAWCPCGPADGVPVSIVHHPAGRRALVQTSAAISAESSQASAGPGQHPLSPHQLRASSAAQPLAALPVFRSFLIFISPLLISPAPYMPKQGEKTDMIFPKPPASSGTRSPGLRQLLPRQAGQAAAAAPPETGRTIRNTRSAAGMREIPWRGALVSLGRICSQLGRRPEVTT